jgi:shikimate kinase
MQELNENELNEIRFQVSARIDFIDEIFEEYGREDFYVREQKTLLSIMKKIGNN